MRIGDSHRIFDGVRTRQALPEIALSALLRGENTGGQSTEALRRACSTFLAGESRTNLDGVSSTRAAAPDFDGVNTRAAAKSLMPRAKIKGGKSSN
jgi:hypothetical protein